MELSDRGARVVAVAAGILAALAVSDMIGKAIDFVLGAPSPTPSTASLIANVVRVFLGPLIAVGVGLCAGVVFYRSVRRRLLDEDDEPATTPSATASSDGTAGDIAWGSATFVVVFILMALVAVTAPGFFVGNRVLTPGIVFVGAAVLAPVFASIAAMTRMSSRRAARQRRANFD